MAHAEGNHATMRPNNGAEQLSRLLAFGVGASYDFCLGLCKEIFDVWLWRRVSNGVGVCAKREVARR
jgi:hypothetical protein